MKETNDNPPPSCCAPPSDECTRRSFFAKLSLGLAGLCTAILGVPLVGFIVAPLFRKVKEVWVHIGPVENFTVGETVSVPFPDSSPLPWAGITAKSAAWLRRDGPEQFTAFSVHCTHMGCPVRWLQDAKLFMCPCHGGVYYQDGSVAAGPPPAPLVRYKVRVVDGQVEIKAAAIPITTTL